MPLVTAVVNDAVDAVTDELGLISAHTGDPGTTGANEASGSPYARQSLSWPGASSGSDTAVQVSIPVPAGGPYTHFGTWSADGTTFKGGNALSSPETFAAAGTLKVTLTVPGTAS